MQKRFFKTTAMKANIHPTYYENLKIVCACGNTIVAGSTRKELKTELCSACHPFYTGKQKLVDTAGRVDKFMEKVKKSQAMKNKKVVKSEASEDAMKMPKEKEGAKAAKKTAKATAKKTAKKK